MHKSLDELYHAFLTQPQFPCVAARESVARQQAACFVADHMACPKDDAAILDFLYNFIDNYRTGGNIFYSAAIIFKQPGIHSEEMFDQLMWQRLQALSDRDAVLYPYDKRVVPDPGSQNFSFSLKEEAFFIIGMHPHSSRPTRRFDYAALVFNPHAQFEKMKETGQYVKMKNIVRKRDLAYSGSVNPMLNDFGNLSEVYQYSGRQYDEQWECPLKINHAATQYHSAPQRDSLPFEERATP
jgi:FPC/CPF motif-containing protein YcgG